MVKPLAKRAVTHEWCTPKRTAATPDYYRAVQDEVIAWWREHQRTDLPWRPPPPSKASTQVLAAAATNGAVVDAAAPTPLANPYEVWVSEVMSQQTRMDTVIPYFRKWMERFPSIEVLAGSSEEEVKAVWAGMGYYRRALYLHKGAQYLLEWQRKQSSSARSSSSFSSPPPPASGCMPSTQQELLKVPGIGPYTSAAIAAVCFGEAVCSVDGNVIRVLSRLRGERGFDPKVPANVKRANVWGQALMGNIPETAAVVCRDPSALNQGLMELGASVCRPGGAPLCASCPLREHCCAYALLGSGEIEAIEGVIPVRAVVAAKRIAKEVCVVHELSNGAEDAELERRRYVVVRRPSTGLLAGMLEFPTVSAVVDEDKESAEEDMVAGTVSLAEHPLCTLFSLQDGGAPSSVRACGSVRHVFSHILMDVEVLHVRWPPQVEANKLCRAVARVIDDAFATAKGSTTPSASTRVSVMTEPELRRGAPSRLMLKVLQQASALSSASSPAAPKRTRSASLAKKGGAATTLPAAKTAKKRNGR